MNKQVSLLFLAGTLGCAQLFANDIEPGKEFYNASPASGPVVLDGVLSEWSGVPVLSDPKFYSPKSSEGGAPYKLREPGDPGTLVLFEEYAGGTWTGPDDHTSAVQIVWDTENIYLGIVVTDDYHENAANSAWNGDSAQMMFTSGARDNAGPYFLYNFALGGTEEFLGDVIIMEERLEGGPGGVDAVVTRNPATKKTTYEIKIPATALNLGSFTAGQQVGVGMAINDGDEATPGQKGWGGWGAHSIVHGKHPSETGLLTLLSSEPAVEILGTGVESLLGGDLTDPENDGDEAAGPGDPSWNWVAITSSSKGFFDGGEGAFNIFDNQVGGGNAKWCCDDATEEVPQWVSVQFPNPVSLTHFTMTSGNDAPGRDPHHFQIQGSDDGLNFTPIYTRESDLSLWTERNQTIKITLPVPAPAYRHIRYFVTHTPDTVRHQINEIEYFGTFGGADLAFLSAINPTVDAFSFRATDVGASVVDAANTTLTIDGEPATLTSSKSGDATDFRHQRATPFLPGSEHTYAIRVRDAQGNNITSEGTFTTINYALLLPEHKVTADTSKPGFIWRVHQNDALRATELNRPIQQLAGLLGENFADPFAQGVAIAPGTPGANENLPVTFEIATVINMDEAFGSNGEFQPDEQMPGIPGLSGDGLNGIAGEIITYLELPAGRHTLIVNSDDGFRTIAGAINDVFRAQVAGEFNAGRGASDTVYTVYAEEAGVYPFRTIWMEGGGGANIEWKSEKPDGTRVLLNDEFNDGIRAFRAATGLPTGISEVIPLRNAGGVSGDSPIRVSIQEGATAVDLASIQLQLNGQPAPATPSKSGNTITVSHQPGDLFPAGSTNTATITYTAGGVARTETWQFVVANYGFLTADLKVTPDTTKPGFIWNVHQNEAFTATELNRPERQLAGLLGPNLADPLAQGVAIAPGTPGATDLLPIRFEIDTVINMDEAFGSNGEFTPDDQMPGIPGTTFSTDGIAGEIITYIELPAGKNRFIVNSDDGFRTTAGNVNDIFDAQVLGFFNAGRGAADTVYDFFVEEAGVYPFRTVWMEGGGGANIEWKVEKADGTRALINDAVTGGPKAYRAVSSPLNIPAIISVSPSINDTKAIGSAPIEVRIQEGATALDTASVQLTINGNAATPTVNRSGNIVTVTHQPGTPLAANATHTATIRFTSGGTERVAQWSFTVPPVTLDNLHDYPGLVLGRAKWTDDAGGRSGTAGDYAIDLGITGGAAPSVLIPDASFLNATAADDQMTFSIWVKKYDNANSSAFWADSPSSPSGMRGFQAHTPWSDNNVYFDTAGCCAADETRISGPIADFPGFTGPAWWTGEWHHWAFVKNGASKQIYIDGELFLDAFGFTVLPTDFERIWLGAEGGANAGTINNMHGLIDDFAVFGTGLTPAQIQQLASGTLPSALPATAKPLAYWDFNDVTVSEEPPVISVSRSGSDLTLTWTNGGTLQGSPAVGPDADWQDLDSDGSYETSADEAAMFFRVVQ